MFLCNLVFRECVLLHEQCSVAARLKRMIHNRKDPEANMMMNLSSLLLSRLLTRITGAQRSPEAVKLLSALAPSAASSFFVDDDELDTSRTLLWNLHGQRVVRSQSCDICFVYVCSLSLSFIALVIKADWVRSMLDM